MAKNEAKIRFTAETGEFNDAIKGANTQMGKLRAEAKLNETQMQRTGETTEGLQRRHELLEQQLKVSRDKVEALSSKVEAAARIFGEGSDEVAKLETQLANARTAEEKLLREVDQCNDKLKAQKSGFDDAGDAARNSGEGFTVAKGAIADLASEAIQLAIGKITEFIGYLRELPEATRELRQDMATLETSFDKAGFTTEEATETWKNLYRVFGEDDRAVEAANLIAKMSDNQEDLNDWVTITQGIWGTYQDSLPVEGLAEASMESAKTGQVTGVLADALNWSSEAAKMFAGYMSKDVTTAEDAFNEALKECTTEEERQALITETLTSLYGDAAAKYEEASGAQLDAKDAIAEVTIAQNNLATAIEPVTTAWDGLKAELITAVTPAIEGVCGALKDALAWLQEHPVAAKVLVAVLGTLSVAFSGLAIALGVYAAAQWVANSAMAPMILPILGVVAAITAVVAIIVLVIEYWDKIKAAAITAWEAIKSAFATAGEWFNVNVVQPVKNFFSGLWDGIKTAAVTAWDGIKTFFATIPVWFSTNVIQPIVNFFTGLWTSIVNIWNTICNAVQVAIMFIGSIMSAAFQIITLPFRFIWENCKQYVFAAWEWIKSKVTTAINAVKTVITNVMNSIKQAFTTAWNAIKNVFTTAWNSIKAFLTPILNSIKNTITTAWNGVKSTITSVMNSVKSTVSSVWNSIKAAVSSAANAVKTRVTSAFNAVKTTATSIWNSIKTAISNAWNGIKTGVSNAVNAVKSTVSNVFNSIKTTATNVWNSVKTAIMNPITAAKNHVKGALDEIKGFFSNLKLKLPNIKLPHFKIKGSFSLDPPSVPKLSVDWYKNGGVMMAPTIFGVNGNRLMAGGEAGPEAIAPISTLQSYITGAVERAAQAFDVSSLAAAIEDLASRPVHFSIGDREIALATASASDSVNGLRSTFKTRGLIVD